MSMDYNMEMVKAMRSKGGKRQQYRGAQPSGTKLKKRVRKPPHLRAPKGTDSSRKYF